MKLIIDEMVFKKENGQTFSIGVCMFTIIRAILLRVEPLLQLLKAELEMCLMRYLLYRRWQVHVTMNVQSV